MKIKERIILLFEESNEWSIKDLVDILFVSKQAVHYVINQLLEEKIIEKLGRTPKTIYRKINQNRLKGVLPTIEVSLEDQEFLLQNFLIISDTGLLLQGIEAFGYWCHQRKLPTLKTLEEFKTTKNKYLNYVNSEGLIDGLEKIKSTKGYEKIWLDELFYIDFYAIERFGKTRLGTLLHFAKQGQNKMLMKIIVDEIQLKISNFVKNSRADAIAFVPPTIRREVQIMKFLETHFKIHLPIVKLNKISGIIPVPQKSLNKLEERIVNAENTFSVPEKNVYNHIILIDDAVGSGATLNMIAEKLKAKKVGKKITGLAIVGSFKGFDVITDV